MPNLGGMVRELKTQRDRPPGEVDQLNAALSGGAWNILRGSRVSDEPFSAIW
jgi:hypothetical protein